MADETDETGHKRQVDEVAHLVRSRLAQVIWVLSVIAALILALGALLVVLEANPDNPLVSFVTEGAQTLDLGVFDKSEGIKQFTTESGEPKEKLNVLFNWGLAAVAWLVVGRLVSGVIRP